MKLLVTATGNTLDSAVDPRFGRARWFVVVDTDTNEVRAIDNAESRDAAQGAGIQAGEMAANSGAQVVLTGHCGPKAFRALRAAGIQLVIGASGTVREAVESYRAGALAPADEPDVEGHWV